MIVRAFLCNSAQQSIQIANAEHNALFVAEVSRR